MKPDRFEKMVERAFVNPRHELYETLSLRLLRRQHAAMVRMVKLQKTFGILEYRPSGPEAYQDACDDLLERLTQYKKGTP